MVRVSNICLVVVNFLAFVSSIALFLIGISLAKQGNSECDRWLDKFLIGFGVVLVIVSLLGMVGAWYRKSSILCIYLVLMLVLIIAVFILIIFTFAVANRGPPKVSSGNKEYRLGDYSRWLQNRVIKQHNWNKIKSCLQSSELCSNYRSKHVNDDFQKFYAEKLSPLQSGCCKPPRECKFVYQSPTMWNKTTSGHYSSPDCGAWENDPNVLCFNCNSCKAGLLQNIRMNWRQSAINSITALIFLIIVYIVGIYAFRNSMKEEYCQGSI